MQKILDKHFEAAAKEPLVVSFEDVRQNFIDNLPSPPNSSGTSGASGTSYIDRLNKFFSLKINVVYTGISAVLIGALIWSYWDSDSNGPPSEETITTIKHEEDRGVVHLEQPVRSVEESSPEKLISEQEKVIEEIQVPKGESDDDREEDAVNEIIDSNAAITTEMVSTEVETPEEPAVEEEATKPTEPKKQQRRPRASTKPPVNYKFTPYTAEEELRKFARDLKDEGITLTFSKLKYKEGKISKIEGTIEMDGYYATFYTDEFDDFTFKWIYSKHRGGSPADFDIIINTPMSRKSNTDIKIDELD